MADEKTEVQNDVHAVAPGTVVSPGMSPTPTAPVSVEAPQPAPQPPAPEPPMTTRPTEPMPSPQQPPQQVPSQITPSDSNDPNSVTWSASEFMAHDKTGEWYGLLGLGALAASGLMYILTKDFVSVGVVLVAALIFGIYGAHKPRQLEYRVDKRGLSVGDKRFSYNEFRSFSVLPEGAFSSIMFMPLKRFAVPLSIYYAPQDEDKIISLISEQLPYEQRRRDAVDSLMRKVRF